MGYKLYLNLYATIFFFFCYEMCESYYLIRSGCKSCASLNLSFSVPTGGGGSRIHGVTK